MEGWGVDLHLCRWEAQGYFKPNTSSGAVGGGEPFVISMPPPNVTGALHMGHAMFVTLEVILFFHLLCFALLTLCFLENMELFALSREFLTVGGSWPYFHIAKIHGKWKSQDGWSLLDDYAWDIFFLLVLGFCSCFFRSYSQDEKKREFKMGGIALQNTELSFGFARIQWHGFGAWEVGLPYGFLALTMLELLLRYTCPLSCTPAGQQAKCRQCWVGGWVWVLVLILQVLHMRKRQCCEWNIRSKLILWQFFFLLVELNNLVGCGENVGFPRYQANRSHSWRICEQSLGMERKV